jgi:hypothetical protein
VEDEEEGAEVEEEKETQEEERLICVFPSL